MRKALFTIFLIVFIDLMGFGIIMPNLQLYGQRFGIHSYFALTLVGAVYSIFQFLFSPILGAWSDRIGRRPVLLISQAGTLVGFLTLFVAHYFESGYGSLGLGLIFASRIIDGISGGNISTASAYVADITTPENRAKGMGLIGAAFGLGFMFGPVIGGLVAYYLGLQWVPIAAAVFSAGALLMTFTTLPESFVPESKAEKSGKHVVVAGNSASIPTAVAGHKADPEELRRYSPGIILHALARPTIGPMILMSFVNGFAFAGMEQTFSMLIRLRVYDSRVNIFAAILDEDKAARLSSRNSSFLFFMIGIIIVVVQGGLIHRLSKKFGEATLVIAGPLLIAVGMLIIALDLPHIFPGIWIWTGFVAGSVCLSLGSSLFNPSMQSLVSRHATAREQGNVLGAMQGMASLARALGPIIAGLLFQYVWANSPWQGSAPYYLSSVMCFVVVIWAISMRRKLIPPAVVSGETVKGGAGESVQLSKSS